MMSLISRRRLLQGGLAAFAGAALPVAAAASIPAAPPAPGLRGMAAIQAALSGVGLYVGNEWYDWDSPARRFALAKIRAWGFDFVCPKVGGYGRTTYQDAAELARWTDAARGVGLGFAPFIYTIPATADTDAVIAAQIAQTTGIVCVDMEDEWGTHTAGTPAVYQGAAMAAFGRRYRAEAGNLPIIVTGYGDPLTRFGSATTGFPHVELAAWADGYSPQWYVGVYARYHKSGLADALAWVRGECAEALGPTFPLCPSVAIESIYTPDGRMPLGDVAALMASVRQGAAPVFVWEYAQMTPEYAEMLLGPPTITGVRIGRVRPDSVTVLVDTHVPARGFLACQAALDTPAVTSRAETLELTQSLGASGLAPGTACRATLQAVTAAGTSPPFPLAIATAPAVPGVFAQSAIPARTPDGNMTLSLLIANSAATPAADVQLTTVTADSGTVLSPASLPLSLGTLGPRDWQAGFRDRAVLSVAIGSLPPTADAVTLHLIGTAGGKVWASDLPVPLPPA